VTLAVDVSNAHVIDSNATTSQTVTVAANTLIVAFVNSDKSDGSTDEVCTVAASGLTFNLGVRHNGTPGATCEMWWAQDSTGGSRTINLTSNKGAVSKTLKLGLFTDSGGGTPVFGATDSAGNASSLNPVAAAAGAWAWDNCFSGTNFTTLAGHTLQDNILLADGFDGGDTAAVYSLDARATGPGALAISKTAVTNHIVAVCIELPAVGGTAAPTYTPTPPDPLLRQLLAGQQAYADSATATTTPVALSDAGSGSDAVVVSATVPFSEAGSGGDQVTVAASVTLVETGSAVDSLAVSVVVPLADVGSAADTLAVSATVPLADAGSATEALTEAVAVALADVGSGADTLAVSATVPLTDSGSGADAISVNTGATPVGLAETGTATDTLTVTVTVPLSDAGSGSDAAAIAATLQLSDSGSGADAPHIAGAIPLVDTGSAAETLSPVVMISLTDSGTGTEVLTVPQGATQKALAETGTAVDSLTVVRYAPGVAGSWYQLLEVYANVALQREYERQRVPSACPNDGEPLIPGPEPDTLFCKYDGWQYPRDYVRPT